MVFDDSIPARRSLGSLRKSDNYCVGFRHVPPIHALNGAF